MATDSELTNSDALMKVLNFFILSFVFNLITLFMRRNVIFERSIKYHFYFFPYSII